MSILKPLLMFVLSTQVLAYDSWELTDNPWGEIDPDWSADGSSIAYTDERNGRWMSDIYVISASGGTATPVVVDNSQNREAAWSPDGKEIAYRSDSTGNWDIFVVDLFTGISRQLTYHPDDDSWPDWSPDGSEIVFSSLRDGDRDLYIIPAEGGIAQKIADLPTWDEYPCWNTDGQTIVFAALASGDIYKVNIDGTGFGPIVNDTVRDCEPFWSPDGSEIVYIGMGNGEGLEHYEVFIKPYPVGERIRITNDTYPNGWPCYSPDGRYIAYGKHNNNWDIWITDLESSSIEQMSLGRIKAMFK